MYNETKGQHYLLRNVLLILDRKRLCINTVMKGQTLRLNLKQQLEESNNIVNKMIAGWNFSYWQADAKQKRFEKANAAIEVLNEKWPRIPACSRVMTGYRKHEVTEGKNKQNWTAATLLRGTRNTATGLNKITLINLAVSTFKFRNIRLKRSFKNMGNYVKQRQRWRMWNADFKIAGKNGYLPQKKIPTIDHAFESSLIENIVLLKSKALYLMNMKTGLLQLRRSQSFCIFEAFYRDFDLLDLVLRNNVQGIKEIYFL